MAKKSSVLSQREKRHRVKQSDTMLTEKMINELKALKHREINLADEDAPEITDWEKAVVGKFYR